MRARSRAMAIAGVLILLVACGGGTKKKKVAAAPPPTTTSTVPQPGVTVTPESGPVGTKFALTARNFAAGDNLTFEIDFPGGRKFTGQAHAVGADGTVSTTFLISSLNPPGDYVVKATTAKGQAGQGHFTVTAAAAGAGAGGTTTTPTTAKPRAATTTTTRKP